MIARLPWPLRLDPVAPGGLHRQRAGGDSHASFRLGSPIVAFDSASDPATAVPAGVVPDQLQRPFSLGRQAGADAGEEPLVHTPLTGWP